MSFLQDYLYFNEGNECPKSYHHWTAIFLISAASGKRVWIKQGLLTYYINLYLALIGNQGSRKSTAKDIGRDVFMEALPDMPCGAAVQSMQDIIKFMASTDCLRAMNIEGSPVEYKPYILFINELKNWLSVNPGAMIDFLTDIYDRREFDSSTIKRGLEKIKNPCVGILACETPKWITERLKMQVISGGFTRRMIYIYETDPIIRIPEPYFNDDQRAARLRCVEHLRQVQNYSGQFIWTPEAKEFYSEWYLNLKTPNDEMMAGYYQSKHVQLMKVAMCLALMEKEPKLVIELKWLMGALALLEKAEVNMPLLSMAAGRNELAPIQQRLLEIIKSAGGSIRRKELVALTDKDLQSQERHTLLTHLEKEVDAIRSIKIKRGELLFEEIWMREHLLDSIRSGHIINENNTFIWKNGK